LLHIFSHRSPRAATPRHEIPVFIGAHGRFAVLVEIARDRQSRVQTRWPGAILHAERSSIRCVC
jgi:hypothetical protein